MRPINQRLGPSSRRSPANPAGERQTAAKGTRGDIFCLGPEARGRILLQGILDGFVGALALAPLAAAFALVYAPTRVFHLAAGAIYAFVPYVAATVLRAGFPAIGAVLAALSAGVMASVLLEVCSHRPLEKKQSSALAHFIASLGTYTIIVQLTVLVWGAEPVTVRGDAHSYVRMGALYLSTGQIITASIAIVVLAAVYVWIPLSRSGLRLRALASNPSEAALRGLDVASLRLLAFAISGFLCSAAALGNAWDVGFDPYSGTTPILLAIVATAIGGRHSFVGPLIGMLVIGVVRGAAVIALSAQWQDVAAFLLLALVLYARPGGIVNPRWRAGVRQ